MKKSIIMLASAFWSVCALAAPVSRQQAADVALNYISSRPGASSSMQVRSVQSFGDALYMVNFAPKGFAVVAADDTYYPIIGYSTESNLSLDDIPLNMGEILSEATRGVEQVKTLTAVANRQWKSIAAGEAAASRASGERVEPLIQVLYNQSSPFNKYCPKSGSKQTIVGCVAVAMSQAMGVQRYPAQPFGQKTYGCAGIGTISIDYEKENKYDWDKIITGSDGWDEAARLMYHAGVSVSMEYGVDGSGIPSNQVYRITDALKEHFGYGSQVTYHWRSSYTGDWEQLILNELYADRAVVYNAIDTKGGYGHSFNLDGFDGDKMFHVNWGWGGVGNGYFRLDHLADAAMNMNYDDSHVAVVGIGGGNAAFRDIELSDLYVEQDLPAGSYVSVLKVNGEVVDDTKMKISLTGEYDKASGEYLESPFAYSKGIITTKRPISASEGPVYLRVEVTMLGVSGSKLRQGFSIDVEPRMPVENKTTIAYSRDTKTFVMHTRYGATVKLTNSQGAAVALSKDPVLADYTFSRDALTAGDNKLEITYEGETKVINIKK